MARRSSLALILAAFLLSAALGASAQQLSNGIVLTIDATDPRSSMPLDAMTVRGSQCPTIVNVVVPARQAAASLPNFPVWYPSNPNLGYTYYANPFSRVAYGVMGLPNGYGLPYAYSTSSYGYGAYYGSSRVRPGNATRYDNRSRSNDGQRRVWHRHRYPRR